MKRDTYWACCYCGNECQGAEPATFRCCGEIGHTEERYEDTGEPVDAYQTEQLMTARSEAWQAANVEHYNRG
jgi:hypothetical protein